MVTVVPFEVIAQKKFVPAPKVATALEGPEVV
jgi:hypothetical protein